MGRLARTLLLVTTEFACGMTVANNIAVGLKPVTDPVRSRSALQMNDAEITVKTRGHHRGASMNLKMEVSVKSSSQQKTTGVITTTEAGDEPSAGVNIV